MQLQFTTVDVFTKTRYVGNPLGVVRVPASLRSQLSEHQKQRIANEFNLSEITFLHEPTPEEAEIADYDIFTAASRMTFAGHPTIGTSIYVAKNAAAYPTVSKLRTIAGVIPFEFNKDLGTSTVGIPHDVYFHKDHLLPHPFPQLNGSDSTNVPLVSIVKGMAFNIIRMKGLDALAVPTEGLLPLARLYKGEHLDQGSGWDIGYTGSFYYADQGYNGEEPGVRQLRTRSLGSREDPGTGSASCALAAYLSLTEDGERKRKFHLTQGVEMGRRCDIYVEVVLKEGGKEVEGLKMSGAAVEVMEGVLTVGE
ncbi:phenazine biosynthesis protein-like protein phzf family [Karstenula rhodostoma CBS 690.94]|uniref:Phenazine biosynthesis protein-like protein phzf family n=1 Tax=Karstenula rhodostoma CBS 690.94 TaxID=1392251 RepID=A0A9P4U896_9PLEO|nr:phenazine biosynthesis protein-like protein phzf family [Karstenula rhodostoma CBS 690.94]